MEILLNNIEQIKKYNPNLAQRITNHTIDQSVKIELMNAESNDTILIYNDISIHSNINPQEEALKVFQSITDTSELSITIILGLGLGYLFKRACLNTHGKIIVYEPNLDILRITLEIVDFSSDLSSNKVFIVNSEIELTSFLDKNYVHNSAVNLVALASAGILYPKEVGYLRNEFPKIRAHLEGNYLCMFEKSPLWVNEGMKNLAQLMESYNLDILKGAFKSVPAIIVSSGPSLDENLEVLAENKNKALIFSVGNACRSLYKYGIKPDFLTFIEVYGGYTQVKDLDITDVNIIAQPIVSNGVLKLNSKRKFIFYGNNDLFSRWLSIPAQLAISDFETKGTVSYCALYSAFMMGCNPIILLGQDLAYTNGRCYASTSAYGAIKLVKNESTGKYEAEVDNLEDIIEHYFDHKAIDMKPDVYLNNIKSALLDKITAQITFVDGQNGEKIPTDPNYASFIKFFEEFAYDNSILDLINCSIGGAKINGFKEIALTDVFKTLPILTKTSDEVIETLSCKTFMLKDNVENIKMSLESLINDIEKFEPQALEGVDKAKKLTVELKKYKLDIQKISSLSNDLINLYIRFKEKLFNKNSILSGCVFKEIFEISKILEYGSHETGLNDLLGIAKSSENLYTTFLKNVVSFKEISKKSFLKISEKK